MNQLIAVMIGTTLAANPLFAMDNAGHDLAGHQFDGVELAERDIGLKAVNVDYLNTAKVLAVTKADKNSNRSVRIPLRAFAEVPAGTVAGGLVSGAGSFLTTGSYTEGLVRVPVLASGALSGAAGGFTGAITQGILRNEMSAPKSLAVSTGIGGIAGGLIAVGMFNRPWVGGMLARGIVCGAVGALVGAGAVEISRRTTVSVDTMIK
ncbi:hypothetical protein ACFL6Y_11345 [Elusimicrobiota bacterium]